MNNYLISTKIVKEGELVNNNMCIISSDCKANALLEYAKKNKLSFVPDESCIITSDLKSGDGTFLFKEEKITLLFNIKSISNSIHHNKVFLIATKRLVDNRQFFTRFMIVSSDTNIDALQLYSEYLNDKELSGTIVSEKGNKSLFKIDKYTLQDLIDSINTTDISDKIFNVHRMMYMPIKCEVYNESNDDLYSEPTNKEKKSDNIDCDIDTLIWWMNMHSIPSLEEIYENTDTYLNNLDNNETCYCPFQWNNSVKLLPSPNKDIKNESIIKQNYINFIKNSIFGIDPDILKNTIQSNTEDLLKQDSILNIIRNLDIDFGNIINKVNEINNIKKCTESAGEKKQNYCNNLCINLHNSKLNDTLKHQETDEPIKITFLVKKQSNKKKLIL